MHAINDPHDDLMLAPRETTVVTQATAANDTFPEPYSVDEGMTMLSDLGEVQSARSLRGKRPRRLDHPMDTRDPMIGSTGHGYTPFLPGMGDLDGVRSARNLPDLKNRNLNHPMGTKARMVGRSGHGFTPFLPGMGDLEGQKAAPARMRAKIRVRGTASGSANKVRVAQPAPRMNAGFMPGMGDILPSPGIMLAVGAIALYFAFRR